MENNKKELYYVVGFKGDGCLRTGVTLYEKKELSLSDYHPLENSITENYRMLCKEQEFAGSSDRRRLPIKTEPYCTYKLKSVTGNIVNDVNIDGFSYDIERKNVLYGTIYVYVQKHNNQYYDLVTGNIIPKGVIKTVDEIFNKSDFEEMIDDLNCIKMYKEIYMKTINEIIFKLLEGYNNYRSALEIFNQRYHEYEEMIKCNLKPQKTQDEITYLEEIVLDEKIEEVKKLVLSIRN